MRFIVVMVKGEERGVTVVWLAKVVVILSGRSGKGGAKKEAAFVQHMKLAAPLDGVEKNPGCFWVMWSTSDKFNYRARGKMLKHHVVKVGECYGFERLPSMMGGGHHVRSDQCGHPITTGIPWSPHWFFVNLLYFDSPGQTATGAGGRGE